MGNSMRTDQHRYIEWLDAEDGTIAARELYDHGKDPRENENLAGRDSHRETLERLGTRMWTLLEKPEFPFAFARPGTAPKNTAPDQAQPKSSG